MTDNILKDIGSRTQIRKTDRKKSSNSVILEIEEEDQFTGSDLDSKYSLIDEDENSQNETRSTGNNMSCLFEKDMDMNEGNFNLIKNSRIFKRNKKSKHGDSKNGIADFDHILDSDEMQNESNSMSKRLSEEDNLF